MTDQTQNPDTMVTQIQNNSHSLWDAVDKFSNYLSGFAHKYGPDAYHTILQVAQIQAIYQLIIGGICLVITILMGIFAIRSYRKMEPNSAPAFIVPIIIGIFTGIPTCVYLFDLWAWVTAFDPQLGIAGQIYSHFIGQQ